MTAYRGLFTPCSHSQQFFSISCLGSPAGLRKALGKLYLGVYVHACAPCELACVCNEPVDAHPSAPSKTVSPLGEQSCTVSALQVSWGVSWPLFIIRVLCTRRQSWPSVTTLCKWVKEMNIKPVQQGLSGSGVFLANSAQAPLRVLL